MAQARKSGEWRKKQAELPTNYQVISHDDAESLSNLFVLLADVTRIRIVYLLMTYEGLYVDKIAEILGVAQSTVSQHLRIMRTGGLVSAKKKGTFAYYSLKEDLPEHIHAQLEAILSPTIN